MTEVRNDFAPGVITGTEVKEVFALAAPRSSAARASATPTIRRRSSAPSPVPTT
jgi:hypothetical protein